MSAQVRRRHVRARWDEIADEAAREREAQGTTGVLRAKAARRLDPHARPKDITRSRAPLVHCRDSASRRLVKKAYRAFCDLHRATTARLRQGQKAGYPAGGVPIGCRLAHALTDEWPQVPVGG